MARTVRIQVTAPGAVGQRIGGLLQRKIEERCGARVVTGGRADLTLELARDRRLRPESFRIADGKGGSVRIAAPDDRGLLFGAGKWLRDARWSDDGLQAGPWRGVSAPDKPFRAIYFATHFHNFYHDAPIAEVERYVEELGLWGTNTLVVWYDMHHFNGHDDPAAAAMRARLHAILAAAKRIGMGAGLTLLANEGYADSPAALRLTPPTQIEVRGMYGVELCPSKPGAREVVLEAMRRSFETYRDIGLDCISIWPYDQGGCGCKECAPYGSNGFLRMARPIAALARSMYPGIKVILSTWLFDAHKDEGEWAGLTEALRNDHGWLDMIMADSHTVFPRYPLEKGVPGGLPLVSFPEISMWGMSPWGGYGANPLPGRFQGLYDSARAKLAGGFPYSEGLYEDMNKALYAGFYWQQNRPAAAILREYAAYEFGPEAADDVLAAVAILERNHTRPPQDAGSAEALAHLDRAATTMPARAVKAWRWRILYNRALLDRDHYAHPGQRTEAGRQALRELVAIYHAENGLDWVKPPAW
jgi:hypothetical protein